MNEIGLLLILLIGLVLGWKLGWNAACRMYRDRDIAKARERYGQDRR